MASRGPRPDVDVPETLRIRVKPNARDSALTRGDDGLWHATLRSPPVDGKANAELIVLISKTFGVPRSAIDLRSGAGSRLKTVRILRPT